MLKLLQTCVVGLIFIGSTLFSVANAGLINVEYVDTDGPQWTGVVDTNADTLTINSWSEGLGGMSFWTPSTPALMFHAYAKPSFNTTNFNDLINYDISDAWNGLIGQSWGFLSDLTKKQISWDQGEFLGNDARLGWGLTQGNDGKVNFSQFTDQNHFLFIPRGEFLNSISYANSVETSPSSSVSVPEPSTLAIFALGMLGVASRRFKKQS